MTEQEFEDFARYVANYEFRGQRIRNLLTEYNRSNILDRFFHEMALLLTGVYESSTRHERDYRIDEGL